MNNNVITRVDIEEIHIRDCIEISSQVRNYLLRTSVAARAPRNYEGESFSLVHHNQCISKPKEYPRHNTLSQYLGNDRSA
jgi:hypothetical protein